MSHSLNQLKGGAASSEIPSYLPHLTIHDLTILPAQCVSSVATQGADQTARSLLAVSNGQCLLERSDGTARPPFAHATASSSTSGSINRGGLR